MKRISPENARGAGRAYRVRRRVRLSLLVSGALLILVIPVVAGYLWYLNGQIHRVPVRDLSRGVAASRVENILLVGSTSRCALTVQDPAYGLCSQGVTGVNSDVVMILHLNPATHALSILSIPRDLFVPNARAEGANKIDAALAEGPNQLVDAIQEDFGIPIQHYVQLNFDTFAGVVNALGGVRMYFPEPVYDAYSGLNVSTPGCRSLDGVHALQVVRARHLQYQSPTASPGDPRSWVHEAQSDLARIRRNHEFLRVLASALAKRGLGNPLTDQQIAASVAPQLEVDSRLSAFALAHLILTFHTVNAFSAPQLTLPVAVTTFGSYRYKGGNYGEVAFPVQPDDRQVIDQFLGQPPGTNPQTGARLPAPASVSVTVLNGTGAANQAADTARSLRALGFRIQSTGDTAPVANHAETVVGYATPTDEPAAETVAASLSGFVILAMNPALAPSGAQVTVVTGSGFAVNSPPPPAAPPAAPPTAPATAHPTSAHPTSAPTTGTVGTGPPTSPGYQPPTAPVEGLAAWDPRSCTPSGGEGP